MDTILYFPRTNLKSRLFQNVKEVPTIGIPEIGQQRDFWNSRNTSASLLTKIWAIIRFDGFIGHVVVVITFPRLASQFPRDSTSPTPNRFPRLSERRYFPRKPPWLCDYSPGTLFQKSPRFLHFTVSGSFAGSRRSGFKSRESRNPRATWAAMQSPIISPR